ncbi:RNA-directed DNA polymerase [Candidatus Saccharibacteria bacterium]|nr:RNA-directed DNA polymerase [Candidatus Saccharibacteria bacterium]
MAIKQKIDDSLGQFLRKYENQLLAELYVAYLEARANGKRKTRDEQQFEVDEMLNLKILCKKLLDKTYQPSRGIAHIIHNPVIREIFAAPFVDRVVHHWIYDKIYEWWDKHFLYDAYSCREKKGTLMGIKRLDLMIRRASGNYARPVWVVKMDIQGYFMSLDRKKLYDRVIWGLDQQYVNKKHLKEYELLKYAIHEIIFDNPVEGVRRRGWPKQWKNLPRNKSLFWQPEGFGIVIGNLTSQLFSNIYLDQLDRYIYYTLGYKYYGRYVDDFFIVVNEEQMKHLMRDVEAIREYLRRMGLTLHPKKFYIQKMDKGTQFLGGVVYPGHIQPSERIKKNYTKAVKRYAKGKKLVDSIVSYMGHVVHLSHKEFERKVYEVVGWENVR